MIVKVYRLSGIINAFAACRVDVDSSGCVRVWPGYSRSMPCMVSTMVSTREASRVEVSSEEGETISVLTPNRHGHFVERWS